MLSEHSSSLPAWRPYEPSDAMPWNLQRVVHLHRRAAFAAPWDLLQRDLADGPHAAVQRLLVGSSGGGDSFLTQTSEQQVTSPVENETRPLSAVAAEFESLARTIGDAAMASGSPGRLQAWWLYRMLKSPDPLGERLALMWHNHFATSNRKVQDLVIMRQQNELFREHGRGPFGELLAAVVMHPAMITWLDADSNRKGHPNENLARELMELFTLGIGNYTENDVKEAARALTGWTVISGRFDFREQRHDDGTKTILGRSGNFDGDELVGLLLENPATAARLAWRICHTFMGEGVVDEDAVAQLAEGLRGHDLDISWGVETVLRSELFFSEKNLGSRVLGPVEFIVGSLRALELTDPPPSTLLLSEWATRMGQELFYPPNVGGWNEGRSWLASRTIVARANFVQALVDGALWHPVREPGLAELVGRHCQSTEFEEQVSWFGRLLWGDDNESAVADVVGETGAMTAKDRLPTAVALLMARPENQVA